MAKKRRSQIVMLDHSKAKVLLLQKYLEKYLNIIANDGYTEKINVFDLFCGEGIYENNGEGSPIAILKTIKDLHFINKTKKKDITHVVEIFNALQKDGKLLVLSDKEDKIRKRPFYINYDNYKTSPEKVYFKLK